MAYETYAPRHRSAPPAKHKAERAPKAFKLPSVTLPSMPAVALPAAFTTPHAKRILVASGIAVAATGVAVSTGVAGAATAPVQLAAATPKAQAADILSDRTASPSRSLDRTALAQTTKAAALSSDSGSAVTETTDLRPKVPNYTGPAITPGSARAIAVSLMPSYGMPTSDFSCIDRIFSQESGWRVHAANPSGAYGIPQALPGSKMASAGPDWRDNATTQIKWGLGYIKNRYGSACNAASFKMSHGWY